MRCHWIAALYFSHLFADGFQSNARKILRKKKYASKIIIINATKLRKQKTKVRKSRNNKSSFQPMEQFSKLSLGGAMISARMAEKIWKSEKMGAKFVRTTSTIYKRDERKLLPQHFTSCTVDVHPYKNILPAHWAHYRVPRKTFKFIPVVPKHTVGPTFVRTESLKPYNLKKCFGGFL